MSSPHTFVASYKPFAFGHKFVLYQDTITWTGPATAAGVKDGGKRRACGDTTNQHTLASVTATLGTNNTTLEIKSGATWTFGVLTVGRSKRAKAAAFKAAIDTAVAAYVP